MSEPEDDRFLLDEIKALEDVLAADELSEPSDCPKDVPKQHNLNDSSHRANLQSRGFGEVTPFHEEEPHVNNSETEAGCLPKSALEANRMLIDLLLQSKSELMAMLEKCLENKAIVEERIKERSKNARSQKILIGSAGMPYFKDTKQFVAPRNEDAQEKTRKGELSIVHLRYTSPWSAKDRNILWRAIRQEAASAVLKTEGETSDTASCSTGGTNGAMRFNLPKNFKALVGPIGEREFDWMKIAAMDFDNRHTPEECKVMWQVFLHPDINRYRWKKEEDMGINRLSKKYKFQDWDSLAKELGTNRSGYQCFIRYNTINQAMFLKESAWTASEDKHLRACVEKFQIGNYIPWGTVGRYMVGRSKMQVYFRWKYNAAPHLKKGRFTREEDATLLEAVKEHSTNFAKISAYVMPHRSSAQLSDHYMTLTQKERGIRSSWTISDDARVLKLYRKYGADWAKIAAKFPGKNRTQLRHRHKSIIRHWEKGISLFEIHRQHEAEEESNIDDEIEVIEKMRRERVQLMQAKYCKETFEVDLELVKHFQLAPPAAKPGRKQKYYKEEELEDMTRKLYVLLRTLNVNLEIPDELEDHRSLTEKDKQLLHSYKEYQRAQTEYAKSQCENIKLSRIFNDDTDEIREIHFRPLCSGDCNKNERFRLNDRLDYQSPPFLNCQIQLNLQLETPTIVLDLIGSDLNEEFDLPMKILCGGKVEEDSKPSAVRKIYVLGPEVCTKVFGAAAAASLIPKIAENSKQENNTTKSKKKRYAKGQNWESSISEGIIYTPQRTIACVEPNHHTLLGLQHIIDGSAEFSLGGNVAQCSVDDCSNEVKESMDILKKRMFQLFKYPVGLSHVLRPELYAKQASRIGVLGCEEIEDDSRRPSSPPPAKKRRLANKKKSKTK